MENEKKFVYKDTFWKTIYITGGIAAFLAVLIFRRFLAVELMEFNGFGIFEMPPTEPVSALEWFTLLEKHKFVGLILLDVVDLINYFLVGLIFFAAYGALRKTDKEVMGFAIMLSMISISIFFSSNQTLGMLHLSNQFQAAVHETEKYMYLAAGEALSAHNQGMGWHVSLFLIYLAGLLISIVMQRSNIFSKATAWTGILANTIGLLLFPALILIPAFSWIPPSLSALFRVVWYVLIALKLFHLSKDV